VKIEVEAIKYWEKIWWKWKTKWRRDNII